MSIQHAILGFLSWKPHTGYELKKVFADSLSFHWSGNNNQIYGTLVKLHGEGLVTNEVIHQDKYPDRKVYTVTPKGLEALRAWLVEEPEVPELRNVFHIQLAWADLLGDPEIYSLLGRYESALETRLLMARETLRRGRPAPNRSRREAYLWKRIEENHIGHLESELAWARDVREGLGKLRYDPAAPAPGTPDARAGIPGDGEVRRA